MNAGEPSAVECEPTGNGISHKFTGYERDSETGNDYALARYYSSRLGQFMSPDPTGIFLMAGVSGCPRLIERPADQLRKRNTSAMIGIPKISTRSILIVDIPSPDQL